MTEPHTHAAHEAATIQMSDMTADLAAVTMTKTTWAVIVATPAMTLATHLSLSESAREIETCLLLGLAELTS
jgi:hypothetical protein